MLSVTSGLSSYTTAVNGLSPKYRILLTTAVGQSGVSEVLVGDQIRYSNYLYPVIYVDDTYAYCTTRVSIKGADGKDGAAGADGYTPVRGTDYWTPDDQEEIVQQVITALGTPVFGMVDENNVITLTGALESGTYTLMYEDAEGNVIEIGTLALNDDGPIDIPWVEGYSCGGSSGVTNTAQAEYITTEKMPLDAGYEYTLQTGTTLGYNSLFVYYYAADGAALGRNEAESFQTTTQNSNKSVVLSPKDGAVTFKLQSYCQGNYDQVKNSVTVTRRYVG